MKKITDNILAFLLGSIVVIMFAQVVFRYAFNNSLSWSEEVAKFLFIWITFIGTALGLRDRMHIGVEFLVDKLPGKWKPFIELFNISLITAFNGIMAVIGFMWVFEVSGTLSPALGLPLNIVFYAALPSTAVLAFVFGLVRIWKEFNELKNDLNFTAR